MHRQRSPRSEPRAPRLPLVVGFSPYGGGPGETFAGEFPLSFQGEALTASISVEALDTVLAIQIAVGWAGESRESTKRLGWWNTDLVDATGGGDFMARLLPRTHAWASLEAVREVARRIDEQGRRG